MANIATAERKPTKGLDINANAMRSTTAAAEANPKRAERRIGRTRLPGWPSASRDIQKET
jgi:hypothetical protein